MSRAKLTVVPGSGYSDDTGPRIEAYLASVRLLSGLSHPSEVIDRYVRGRCAIQRLADSATGQGTPKRRLSARECADALFFIRNSEPARPDWWTEPDDSPSHVVGFNFVIEAAQVAIDQLGGVQS